MADEDSGQCPRAVSDLEPLEKQALLEAGTALAARESLVELLEMKIMMVADTGRVDT